MSSKVISSFRSGSGIDERIYNMYKINNTIVNNQVFAYRIIAKNEQNFSDAVNSLLNLNLVNYIKEIILITKQFSS
jgi:hypothetical protein